MHFNGQIPGSPVNRASPMNLEEARSGSGTPIMASNPYQEIVDKAIQLISEVQRAFNTNELLNGDFACQYSPILRQYAQIVTRMHHLDESEENKMYCSGLSRIEIIRQNWSNNLNNQVNNLLSGLEVVMQAFDPQISDFFIIKEQTRQLKETFDVLGKVSDQNKLDTLLLQSKTLFASLDLQVHNVNHHLGLDKVKIDSLVHKYLFSIKALTDHLKTVFSRENCLDKGEVKENLTLLKTDLEKLKSHQEALIRAVQDEMKRPSEEEVAKAKQYIAEHPKRVKRLKELELEFKHLSSLSEQPLAPVLRSPQEKEDYLFEFMRRLFLEVKFSEEPSIEPFISILSEEIVAKAILVIDDIERLCEKLPQDSEGLSCVIKNVFLEMNKLQLSLHRTRKEMRELQKETSKKKLQEAQGICKDQPFGYSSFAYQQRMRELDSTHNSLEDIDNALRSVDDLLNSNYFE